MAAAPVAVLCALVAAAAPGSRAPRPGAKAAPPTAAPAVQPAPAPDAVAAPSAPALPPDLRAPLPPPAAARPKAALRLALPDVKVTGELPPRQVALLESALLAEVRKLEGVSAIGMNEIRAMLSFEYQRQMFGCAADESCLAEIGGALGTDEMVQASVIVEAGTTTFSLRRISMRAARVVGTHTKRLTRAGGEELLGDVGPAVQEVFPEAKLRPGFTRGVDKAMALRLNPPPLPRWPFYATASAALAAAAGGAVMAYLSSDAQKQWRSLADRSLTERVSGVQLNDLERTAESRARTATVLLVGAGVLGAAAGVEALFTDWHGYRAAVDVGPDGAAVKVGGTF
jgi:hypothetical protein